MARQLAGDLGEQPSGGRWGRLWRRLVSSNDDLEAADLQREAEEAGAQPIKECQDREKVTVSGTIASLTQAPKCDEPSLVIELRDGSGAVQVTWMGRRSIPGVECGRRVRVHGRISCHEGERAMYNPRYEILGDAR